MAKSIESHIADQKQSMRHAETMADARGVKKTENISSETSTL